MRKIFLDTNFVMDLLFREEYKIVAQQVLAKAARKKCQFFVSYLTVANVAYIARKLPRETLYRKINLICSLFGIVGGDKSQIIDALTIAPSDFEDGLQYQSALSVNSDFIISRNKKDYYFSTIPVITPLEYLEDANF